MGSTLSCIGDNMHAFPPSVAEDQSPWDAWCKQLDDDGKKEYTFTPEEYIDFYIRIEQEMQKEMQKQKPKPGQDGNAGNPLVFKLSNAGP